MKKLWCSAALLMAAFSGIKAQDMRPELAAALIPDSLKENAHAVVRESTETFRMEALSRSHNIRHCTVTILDPEGDRYGVIIHTYTPGLYEVAGAKATLYDAAGMRVRKMKTSDMEDGNYDVDGAMVDDTRYKYYNFSYHQYPYTVEYELDIKMYNSYSFPDWLPQQREDVSVQHSALSVQLPDNYPLRYRLSRVGKPKESAPEKGMHQYDWAVSNLCAMPHEAMAEAWSRRSPNVLTGPGDFEMQRYKGNLDSWSNMGKFFSTLNANRDVLPDAMIAKVHQLTDTVKTVDEKIAALYQYLQQNTRYVNISLGIGGLQTYDAQYVARRGYGDCKALSNYMQSLLKAAGIPSSCVLIHGGSYETDFIPDFVSHQFNHVIVMVPHNKDTTWLECTSQTLFPGYLSAFTANRYCLAVTADGGALVHTPTYKMEDNRRNAVMQVTVDETGNAHMDCATHYTGQEQDGRHQLIHNRSKEEILRALKDAYSLPTYDVAGYTWQEHPGRIPAIDDHIQLDVNGYAQVTGKRLFLVPNVLHHSGTKLNKDTVRTANLQFDDTYHYSDTTRFTLPGGYKVEALPRPQDLHSAFGDYHSELQLKDNQLTYIRDFKQRSGVFPAATYQDAVNFYDAVYKADRSRAVFVKE